MIRSAILITFLFLLSARVAAQPAPISGVVNSYATVTNIDSCNNTLTVLDNQGFAINDRILVLQMKGATPDLTNTDQFGSIAPNNYNGAGSFEIAVIAALPTNTEIVLKNKLVNFYSALTGNIQVVKIAQYTTGVVTAPLIPLPWDPLFHKGGVIALEVSDTLLLSASIDASGKGFLGGTPSEPGTTPFHDFYAPNKSGLGGIKGEGIINLASDYLASKGAAANGGGGGNPQNAGGGGGGNLSKGGNGGNQTNLPNIGSLTEGGIGGHALGDNTGSRIFLGGGGGGAHQNDGGSAPAGSGGGIVFIRAKHIIGNGDTVRANGQNGGDSYLDGASGGGGAGTLLIDAQDVQGVYFEALGGNGGNAVSDNSPFAYGPGGGGCGGVLYANASGVLFRLKGGKSGLLEQCTIDSINNTSYGAVNGEDGQHLPLPLIPESNELFIQPQIDSHAFVICEGELVNVEAKNGESYEWEPAQEFGNPTLAKQTLKPEISTTFYVDIKRGDCTFRDSVRVEVTPLPQATINGPTNVCKNSVQVYHAAKAAGVTYQWSVAGGIPNTTDQDSIVIAWTGGSTGSIDLVITNGKCESRKKLDITISDQIVPNIIGPTTLCEGDTNTLEVEGTFDTYLWSTGETTPSIKVTRPGIYNVSVAFGGCSGTSNNITVTQNPKPALSILADRTTIKGSGDSIILHSSGLFPGYFWSTLEKTDSIVIRDTGTYYLTVLDSNGCGATASITILSDDRALAKIRIPFVEGAPGQHISIPIILTNAKDIEGAGVYSFGCTIHFNTSLLLPIDRTVPASINDRFKTLTINKLLSLPLQDSVIISLDFIVALGDSLGSSITIDSIWWGSSKPIQTLKENGHFTLLNVCPEGGNRLFSTNGNSFLSVITPNPARSEINLNYGLIEEGLTELRIVDLLGRPVATVFREERKPGTYETNWNVAGLAKGKYFCILRTPSEVYYQALEVRH